MPPRKKRNAISGQFAARQIDMLKSPAYRVLSKAAHQALARVEIEHANHGGAENGNLPVTFADFQKYGIYAKSIAPAIRELEALGFIEITRRGCAGNAEFRQPNLFRLTHRHAKGEDGDGTHEYKRFTSLKIAKGVAKDARENADAKRVARGRKQNLAGGMHRASPVVSASENFDVPTAECTLTGCPVKTAPTI